VYTGLSWTSSPRKQTEAKPNLSQLYLSRLSLAKPVKLNFFKTTASDLCPYVSIVISVFLDFMEPYIYMS
jgi:hypothetical protein